MAYKVRLSTFKNYMLTIHQSVDSDAFKNLYAEVDGEERDILQDGKLSCAYSVSSILFHFKLIDDLHTTVRGLENNLKRSGWHKIEEPRIGSVLIWEPKEIADGSIRRHSGFYIGNARAISNSTEHRVPKIHSVTFEEEGGHRAIEAMYWHENLETAER